MAKKQTKKTSYKPPAPKLDPRKVWDHTILQNAQRRVLEYQDKVTSKQVTFVGTTFDVVEVKMADNYRYGPCYRIELKPVLEK